MVFSGYKKAQCLGVAILALTETLFVQSLSVQVQSVSQGLFKYFE
jgi:hypothetical protein